MKKVILAMIALSIGSYVAINIDVNDINSVDTTIVGSVAPIDKETYVKCSPRYAEHIKHTHNGGGYEICYIGELGVAEYIVYTLTSEMATNSEKVSNRTNDFRKCPIVDNIATISAVPSDYKKSGFDKGHLCPNNDMDFDKTLASETFYMCNMSPQYHALNAGVWKKTEELGHKYAKRYGNVTIVCGTIFENDDTSIRLKNRIAVPSAFFKVFYINDQPFDAYIIPNKKNGLKGLNAYKSDIQTIERQTDLVFKK